MLIVLHVLAGLWLAEQMRGDLAGGQLLTFRLAWAAIGVPGFVVAVTGGVIFDLVRRTT